MKLKIVRLENDPVSEVINRLDLTDNGVKGLEFNIASICVRRVDNSSNVKFWIPITRFKWYLVDFTTASQIPPKLGAAGGLKCHLHGILLITLSLSIEFKNKVRNWR